MAVTAQDKEMMARALELARLGTGKTSPNPAVGAVIARGDQIVGEGYHRRAGTDHAEIVALKKAGPKAAGATLFVTLEPCCHVGRTGPCTEAILAAGIRRVVFATRDPNPKVNGRGARRLRRAGLEVLGGVLGDEAVRLNEGYFMFHREHRPFVIAKVAQSLDGRIATRGGDSKWISDSRSRRMVHQLRSEVDAVVVGAGTVRTDDPRLTVRHVKGRDPYRVVVTSSMKLPRDARLIRDNKDGRTIIATTSRHVARRTSLSNGSNLAYWEVRTRRDGRLDLGDFLAKAAAFGIQSLMVEGGGDLLTEFLRGGLVDKLIVFTAPVVLGDGVDSVGDLRTRRVVDGIRFRSHHVETIGDDSMFVGYPRG